MWIYLQKAIYYTSGTLFGRYPRTYVFDIVFVVVLEAPDTVLIERAAGKRIDPKTKGDKGYVLNPINVVVVY